MDTQTKTIKVARDWCLQNNSWTPICDMSNSEIYYVQYEELSDRKKLEWHDKENYDLCAHKEEKCKTGFIGQNGEFYNTIIDVCEAGQDFMMVFQTGKLFKKFQSKKAA